jgi:hypothetical protein
VTHACADVHYKIGNFTTLQKGILYSIFRPSLAMVATCLVDAGRVRQSMPKSIYACPEGNAQNFLNLS